MSAELGSLVVALSADLARFESDLGRANHIAEQNARDIQRAFQGVKDLFKGLAAGELVREMVSAAREAETASLRLEAVLKATGHSAGIAKEELDGMADSLAQVTQFDDESIRAAEATFLKFGNIVGDTFKDGLKLATDFAAFTGRDVPAAAQVIGRALAAPAEAVGTLEREIGKLNPAQKELIRNFMEAGRVADAQAVVLDIVRGKIGGTAELLNTGLNRSLSDTKKAWDEFLESAGKSPVVMVPVRSALYLVESTLNGIRGAIDALSIDNFKKMSRLDFKAQDPTTDPAIVAAARAQQEAEKQAAWQKQFDDQQAKLRALSDKKTLEAQKALEAERKKLLEQGRRSDEEAMRARYDAANDAYIAEGQRGKAAIERAKDQAAALEREAEAYRRLADPTRELFEQQKRIAELVNSGQLDPEAGDIAWFKVQQKIVAAQAAVIEFKDKGKDAADELMRAFEGWGRQVSKDLATMAVDADYSFDRIRASARNLLIDIVAMQINKRTVQPIIAAASGWIDKGIGSLFGGGDSLSAAAQTDLMAYGIPAYATGTDSVPRTGLAIVHQGERIISAAANDGATGAGITINPTYHIGSNVSRAEVIQAVEEGNARLRADIAGDLATNGPLARQIRSAA